MLAELGAERAVTVVGLVGGGPLSVTDSLLDDRVRLGVLLVRWMTEFEGDRSSGFDQSVRYCGSRSEGSGGWGRM